MSQTVVLSAGFYCMPVTQEELVRYGIADQIQIDEATGVVTQKRSACTTCAHYFGYVMGIVCRLSTAKEEVLGVVYDLRTKMLMSKACGSPQQAVLKRRASSQYGLDTAERA